MKCKDAAPLLWDWDHVVVVVREGCTHFTEAESIICGFESKLRLYFGERGFLSDFWWNAPRSQNL